MNTQNRTFALERTEALPYVDTIKLKYTSVMSPNIARPLTLRTSQIDYATFNQIRSCLIFNIRLLLESEKQQKIFTLCFHGCAGVDFGKN